MKTRAGKYVYLRTFGAKTVEIVVEKYRCGVWYLTAYYLIPSDRIGYSKWGDIAFSKGPMSTKKEILAAMRQQLKRDPRRLEARSATLVEAVLAPSETI